MVAASAVVACGGEQGPQRAHDVRASAGGGSVEVEWQPAPGATSYRVQLADLETRQPLSDAVVVHGTHAVLPGAFARNAGVWVDAAPGTRATGYVSAGAGGGTADAWQLFGPQDFRDGVLRVDFPQLGAGERLGVLLVNAGGRDGVAAQVDVDGVAQPVAPAAPAASAALVSASPPPAALRASAALHEAVRASWEIPAQVAASEPAQDTPQRSFCVVQGLDFSRRVRKSATRVALTDHGAFYVDDEDLSHYEAPFVDALAQAFEQNVWPADTAAFGQPTDVDQDGRILVLLTHELGAHLSGGWLIGYFGNNDLLRGRDASAGCTDGGSNHGEIVYLNDVQNGVANGYAAADLSGTVFPATLAHEIQHMLNLGHRCVEKKCDGGEDTWINEALSKVAEDLAGYGWNGAIGRSDGARYLAQHGGSVRGYEGRSLTLWEGDPIGNYQGAHSFLRFFADRLGPSLAGAVANDSGGLDALEDALGRPLARAMAEWATALLVSNEQGSPFSYSGAEWSPLHQRLRHLQYRAPGEKVNLRTDGIAAFVSGAGQGASAQVRVTSSEGRPPAVVVVRVQGDLPAQ